MITKESTFNEIVDFSVNFKGESTEFECDIELNVEGTMFKAYAVSICNRDLLFYTDKANICYDVNTLSFYNTALLRSVDY